MGYSAMAVPASRLSTIWKTDIQAFSSTRRRRKAGLGWIGKNGLFISTKYGPRVRLGTILTDMELRLVPRCPGRLWQLQNLR